MAPEIAQDGPPKTFYSMARLGVLFCDRGYYRSGDANEVFGSLDAGTQARTWLLCAAVKELQRIGRELEQLRSDGYVRDLEREGRRAARPPGDPVADAILALAGGPLDPPLAVCDRQSLDVRARKALRHAEEMGARRLSDLTPQFLRRLQNEAKNVGPATAGQIANWAARMRDAGDEHDGTGREETGM